MEVLTWRFADQGRYSRQVYVGSSDSAARDSYDGMGNLILLHPCCSKYFFSSCCKLAGRSKTLNCHGAKLEKAQELSHFLERDTFQFGKLPTPFAAGLRLVSDTFRGCGLQSTR